MRFRQVFPRTAQTMGKLFWKIDTMISVRDNAGGNTIYLKLHITSDSIRATSPHYAAYGGGSIRRIKLRFILLDNHGGRWFDATLHDGDIIMKLRSYNGHFARLEGAVTQIPDTLALQLDATAKKIFTVGIQQVDRGVGQPLNRTRKRVGTPFHQGARLDPPSHYGVPAPLSATAPVSRGWDSVSHYLRHDSPGGRLSLSSACHHRG